MSLQIYSLPSEIRGLVFDIDKTLYDNNSYVENQINVLIERLAKERNQDIEITRKQVRQQYELHAKENNGAQQSLGNIFLILGIPIETSVMWREELIKPGDFLCHDRKLEKVVSQLADRYRIIAVTNNPAKVGRDTLAVLGILSLFEQVIGLDTLMKSKPDPAIFNYAANIIKCDCTKMVSIGDRFDVDIMPALSAGMGGIHIESVKDVYSLPDILTK
jgi:HAD superfamily hydrolase (TIGR01549 family)